MRNQRFTTMFRWMVMIQILNLKDSGTLKIRQKTMAMNGAR